MTKSSCLEILKARNLYEGNTTTFQTSFTREYNIRRTVKSFKDPGINKRYATYVIMTNKVNVNSANSTTNLSHYEHGPLTLTRQEKMKTDSYQCNSSEEKKADKYSYLYLKYLLR